jgi:protein-L-isoaspartate(D-aspartate) O-methyltransferase
VTVGLRPGLVILALSLLTIQLPGTASAVESGPLEDRLASRGIRDARVLDAFAKVQRDVFVSASASERQFDDKPLPAGYAQTITQPFMLARMVELLQLKPDARVLAIGTGTGYAAAILAELAHEVFTVEVIPELATTARLRLTGEGYQNVHVKSGDGVGGWREYSPYDAVLVTSIGNRVPPKLIEQLAEGGTLVMVVGPPRGRQVLIRGVKKGFKLHATEAGELAASPPTPPRRDGTAPRRSDDGSTAPRVREETRSQDSDEIRNDR